MNKPEYKTYLKFIEVVRIDGKIKGFGLFDIIGVAWINKFTIQILF